MDGWVTLDVFAHEFTHAVISHSANLVYSYQSGALNESMADVFGVIFVEGDLTYRMGEGVAGTVGGTFRSLRTPTRYRHPDHWDNYKETKDDHGGVHTNSGIPNHAAYLMANGGTHRLSKITVRPMRVSTMEQIYYKALTQYLTPSSKFMDARDALRHSCITLLNTSFDDCSSVINAYAAVGLGAPDADHDAIPDDRDNCGRPGTSPVFNPAQIDDDRNGVGDECDATPTATQTATSTRTPTPTPTATVSPSPVSGSPSASASPTATSTPTATPDLSWIEGVVQNVINELVDEGIPQEVAEVSGDIVRDCLTDAANGGASRNEAIDQCQDVFNRSPTPTPTPTPAATSTATAAPSEMISFVAPPVGVIVDDDSLPCVLWPDDKCRAYVITFQVEWSGLTVPASIECGDSGRDQRSYDVTGDSSGFVSFELFYGSWQWDYHPFIRCALLDASGDLLDQLNEQIKV